MTDKQILGTIYRWLQQANSRDENPDQTRQRLKDFQSFIEQEWQKEDERDLSESDQALYSEEAGRLRGKLDEELYNNLPRVD